MTFRINFLLLWVTLIASFGSVDCLIKKPLIKSDDQHHPKRKISITLNRSKIFADDLLPLLKVLAEQRPMELLQIIYDMKFEETATALSKELSGRVSGLTTIQYGQESTTARQLLQTSSKLTLGSTLHLTLCSATSVLDMFREIRSQRLESHFADWLIILEEEETKYRIVAELEDLVFEGSRISIATKVSSNSFTFSSPIVDTRGDITFMDKGKWSSEGKSSSGRLLDLMTSYEGHHYWNMEGRLMRVVALDNAPFVIFGETYSDGSVEPLAGVDFSIVKALSLALNFTFRVVPPIDGSWGSPQPDGRVTGMVGMIARREADIAVSAVSINAKRVQVIDFTVPYFQGYLAIFTRAPKLKNRALAVLAPFTTQVWICIAAAVLTIGPVLYTIQGASTTYRTMTTAKGDLQSYSFNTFRSFVVQGNLLRISHWPQRLLLFTWYLFCVIVSALYSGTLTAVLAIPAYETPIDSLLDLPRAVEDGYTIGIEGDSSNEYLFKFATGGIYKQIWGLFNHEDRSKSFVDISSTGLQRVMGGKFAFICVKSKGMIIAQGLGRSQFHFGRDTFFPQIMGIAIPSGSPYKDIFNRVLQGMIEGGLIMKWQEDEARKISQGNSGHEQQSRTSAITLTHLQAAFFVIVLGFVLAFVALVLELII